MSQQVQCDAGDTLIANNIIFLELLWFGATTWPSTRQSDQKETPNIFPANLRRDEAQSGTGSRGFHVGTRLDNMFAVFLKKGILHG